MDRDLAERIFKYSVVDKETGCWVWTASRTEGGYGRLKEWKAHRAAYFAFIGPHAEGLELDHLCRNRACVNPDHLEAVTHKENMRRADEAVGGTREYRRKAGCGKGHGDYNINKIGKKYCRACATAAMRQHRIDNPRPRKERPVRLACRKGHDLEGRKHCRECSRINTAHYRAAKKLNQPVNSTLTGE